MMMIMKEKEEEEHQRIRLYNKLNCLMPEEDNFLAEILSRMSFSGSRVVETYTYDFVQHLVFSFKHTASTNFRNWSSYLWFWLIISFNIHLLVHNSTK
jgi:hypothetical protein